MLIMQNADLTALNTFGLSSIAERLVTVQSESDIEEYFKGDNQAPSLVLGGGSNLLLTRDIPGVVLKIEIPGIQIIEEADDHVLVRAGAGVEWHAFVMHCIEHGWAGVENLSLIPGNVGTAPMQNIGAYGVEIKSVFHSLEAYLTDDRAWKTFHLNECRFGYRESVFKRELKGKAVITSVTFRLSKVPHFNVSYGAIESELERMGISQLSLKAISDAVINIRRSTLPDPAQIGNSGSFFKNPVILNDHFERLKADFPEIVGYASGERKTKVAAGWLIEKAGFKGKRFGQHGVHEKQALVLVNYGGASGRDIYNLSEDIIMTIHDMFGIQLEREVNVI
ncbi:MAG: UDP-N-acetylmuramate dehydrogenase [Salibacteraceae bacterium]